MKSIIIKAFQTISILFILSSCQTLDIRGQYVDDNSLIQLEKKKMTKNEVIELIGTPTIVPDYTPDTWYYVQRTLARRAWLTPKVIEQRVVEVKFNKKDMVDDVIVYNNSHIDKIHIVNEYTKSSGTDMNGVQKFVKNIGRFNKTGSKNKRKK